MTSEKQEPRGKGASGLIFVGCLMVGLAVGLVTGNMAPWLIGSLGIGFIAMAIMRAITGQW